MKALYLFLILITPAIAAAQQIDWAVKDRFRLIDYDVSKSDFAIPSGQSALDFVKERMSTGDREKLPPIDYTRVNKKRDSNGRTFSEKYIFTKEQKATAWLTPASTGRCFWSYQEQHREIDCSGQFEFDAITQFGEGKPKLKVELLSSGIKMELDVVITDRLILGLGDSVASGEGNPDVPTKASVAGLVKLAKDNSDRITTGRWMKDAKKTWVEQDAKWFDRQCHRSMLSQHVLAAMRIASANSKESVTLVPLGCSGAEVLDGLLIPQKSPPGGGKYVSDSQLNLAVKNLCRDGKITRVKKIFYKGKSGDEELKPIKQNTFRCDGELRKPDVVLLSVGGNDVGFARVIAWAAIPNEYRNFFGFLGVGLTQIVEEQVCPTGKWEERRCRKNRPVAEHRIKNWLPHYYEVLSREFFDTGLVTDPKKVYLTAYPNPLYSENGELCDYTRSEDGNEQIRTQLKGFLFPQEWDLGMTNDELSDIISGMIQPLNNQLKTASDKFGWNFIDAHVEKIKYNGLCAGYGRKDSRVPVYPHIRNGVWYPERPDQTWAYDPSRPRWFRNTNDSYLFQTDQTDKDINGAFHPDFRVHAVIADELFTAIRQNWGDR